MTDNKPLRVVFFGDSICVGQGVSLYKGWVTRIAQELDELGAAHGREIIVVNSSINGRVTRQALEDMPYHVQSGGVDIMVVQFGMNDCNYWQSDNGLARVSKKAFAANLEEIIERGRRFGAKKIILNNNHPTSRIKDVFPNTNITYQDSNEEYNQIIRQLAHELDNEIIFNDVEEFFNKNLKKDEDVDKYLLSDQLHLSENGHRLYYDYLSPIIKKIVLELL